MSARFRWKAVLGLSVLVLGMQACSDDKQKSRVAENANGDLGYEVFFWRTGDDKEVDFVMYGPRGLHAFEVKRSSRFAERDLAALQLFCADYPEAQACLFYGGTMRYRFGPIEVMPLADGLAGLAHRLAGPSVRRPGRTAR